MEDYVEITSGFFDAIDRSHSQRVFKSPLFDLLEGTRAIEVSNPKLDTGLLFDQLTEAEMNFDCFKEISEEELVGVLNRLFVLLMSWLDNSSLPLTVFSCRYVQEIVEKYTFSTDRSMDNFNLGSSTTNQVLKSYVVGLSKFVGIMINTGNTVLYEEEDITTRQMEMNFLNEVMLDQVIEEIEWAINQVSNTTWKNKKMIINQLNLLKSLNKLPVLFELKVKLFELADPRQYNFFLNVFKEGLEHVKWIKSHKQEYSIATIPEGSFSKFVQASLSNRYIPGDIYDIGADRAYSEIEGVFSTLGTIFTKANHLKDINDFDLFLKYDVGAKVSNFHVITRGIFHLFLVRDDQSILGSAFNLGDLSIEHMNTYSLFYSNITNPKTWNLNSADTEAVMENVNKLMKDLEAGFFQTLAIPGSNRCRQRQLINRNLLVWDSIQVQSENFETEMFQKFKVFDKLNDEGELALPISSYVYCMKVEAMIEFLLLGIDLELYREFEIYSIYWYLNYLIKILLNHATERLFNFNKHKIAKITAKKKKLKNKLELEGKRDTLTDINQKLEQKIQYWRIFQKLINNVCLLLNHYQNEKMVTYDQLSANFISNHEKLFKLRFKPFESIGVPTQLSYKQYQSSYIFNTSKDEISENFNSIKHELQLFEKTVTNEGQKEWINSLVKTCFSFILDLKAGHTKFNVTTGYHPYFPKFTSK